LQKPFIASRQPVDARRQDRLHGGRDAQLLRGAEQAVIAPIACEHTDLNQCADAFFEVKYWDRKKRDCVSK
jgi:hypothetical protein